jgi:hypothetical protein
MEPKDHHLDPELSPQIAAVALTVLVTLGGTSLSTGALLPAATPPGSTGLAEAQNLTTGSRTSDEAPSQTMAERTFNEHFASLPDPVTWSEEPTTRLDHRRTTQGEQAENGWRAPTFLVEEGDLSNAGAAPPNLTVAIPLGDQTATPVTLQRTNDTEQARFTATHVDRTSATQDLTLHHYEETVRTSKGTGTLELTADEQGGYYLRGSIGQLKIAMSPSVDWWTMDPLPAVDHSSPDTADLALVRLSLGQDDLLSAQTRIVPTQTGQTSDGSVGTLTHTVYKFGLMGEMKWCTRYESSWQTKINTIGDQIMNGFSNTNVDIGQYHDHCWLADTLQDAEDCANNGGCYDAQGHAYPYNGDGDDASAYLADAWDDVSHSRQHYTFDGLHVAHVVHDGLLDTSLGGVCGDADAPPSGASAAAGLPLPSGCEDYVSTHEVGHNFDATHDNTEENGCGTVMAQSSQVGCRWNYFNEPGQTEVNNCGNTDGCPRWGTG